METTQKTETQSKNEQARKRGEQGAGLRAAPDRGPAELTLPRVLEDPDLVPGVPP